MEHRRVRKAFFGGSFDPPHLGHLAVARAALTGGYCDRVLFAPSYSPPHKLDRERAPFADRAAMVGLLIAGEPDCELCEIENRLKLTPSYTWMVLNFLRRESPADEFVLLIGGDSLSELHLWGNAAALVENFEVISYPRNGAITDEAALREHWSEEATQKLLEMQIDAKLMDMSSSMIRSGTKSGLTPEIEAYIKSHNLYNRNKEQYE